ncbi:MAG: undecaprenyl-diphosphate phosphatase [Gemmatimonadota bacterium]|nr:undecaprenyl-diphosphate phosphatase [Gemmatimonadota bacterium]MDQ8147117.1 undecaprenyl-diphosphate phosphatase [Gemmatimonadota bacterium]MDQ8148996.1 undecaprenyl-diphosphate phosphatase [Gemmatimonadota bacterium]MDQ8156678.1 undecaprenyl-diphosphate phosphatase [Gemmatimonadota bacterium]MDQ8176446.1 undecaprenyl-diphosphate phosphatase [Gemmatimonadota bacterium]
MQEPTVLQALVLGVLQGLTEFLPVSSSAHLALTPWVMGWSPAGLAFDLALHVGTLVTLGWYFRAEWRTLVLGGLTLLQHRRVVDEASRRAAFIIVASIPAGLAGVLLDDYAESLFRAPAITATALIVMGIVLWAVDRGAVARRARDEMTWRDALTIGCAQVLALVPGVSRSGSTITAGRALGFDRSAAAVFSFLMSMPIIAAAVVLKVPAAVRETGLTLPLLVGVVSAALSSWAAIAFLLRYVSQRGYGLFAIYRVALGLMILALLGTRGAW